MGAPKFKETARIIGKLILTDGQAIQAVEAYRRAHPMVKQLWNRGQNALQALVNGPEDVRTLDARGLLILEEGGIVLPNNLRIKYPALLFDSDTQWSFAGGRNGERTHIYGGKITEHVVQALAKIVVMDQTGEVSRRYKEVMTTHDEGVWCVPEVEAEDALRQLMRSMRAQYIANVKKKRCRMVKKDLQYFDDVLRSLDAQVKNVSHQR